MYGCADLNRVWVHAKGKERARAKSGKLAITAASASPWPAIHGVTVNDVDFETPPPVAVIVTVLVVVTGFVVTVNEAAEEPAATVTLAGAVATIVFELFSVTVSTAPAATGPVRVTVAVDVDPPVTDEGLSTTDAITGAFTVRLACFAKPL
jgi:hypothetical protein